MHSSFRKLFRCGHFFPLALLATLLATLSFAPSPAAWAQSSTSGAIGGTVSDTNGALLPNTTVTVKSVSTGAMRTVKTNSSGEYRVSDLQPGSYTVLYTADGFQTKQENAVTITVGSLSTLSPQLTVGSVSDKVEVTDEAPVMHTQSSDFSSTIDQNTIDNLPINGRRWSNFALLTPGVVSNSDGFGLLSFRGISYLLNNNTVDGADDNQAYFSEARGRTRASYAITQVAVQEFQVNTSNYSAEYGRAAGGVINTVTKSGGNQFHGELFFYDRDNDLGGAINPYTLLTTQNAQGGFNTYAYNPKDWRKQWGFGAGGPLIHNKLFWFYAYDQSRRNFPGTARASDPADTFAPASSALPSNQSCSTSNFSAPDDTTGATDNYAISSTSTPSSGAYPIGASFQGNYAACALAAAFGVSYGAGAAYYTQGLGIISSFLGTVPRVADQVINFPKLDWQISDREHLSLQYNRLRWSSPAGVQTQASNFYGRDSFGNDYVKEDFGIVRLATVLSNSLVNQALVQYGRDFESETSQPPLPNELPMSNNAFARPPETQIGYNFDSQGFEIGKPNILERYALPDERRLQLKDDVTWSHGLHTTKFGLDYNKVSDYINNLYDETGNYSYDYAYDFIADYLHATTGLGGANYPELYYSFGQGFGTPSGEIATREYAGYATDDWRITPRLTLTLGVRYEYEYVPPNPSPNPAVNGTATPTAANTYSRVDDRNNVGPRVGFAWNIFGDSSTTLRGGYGIYYGRIINSNILQTDLESGGPNAQTNFTSLYLPSNCGPTFPNIFASSAPILACRTQNSIIAYLDPHLQNPQVHEIDLAGERNLGHGNVFGLSYLASLGRELDSSVDVNSTLGETYPFTYTIADTPLPKLNGYVTYPHGGKPAPLPNGFRFTTPIYLSVGARPNPNYGSILRIASNVNSSYNALAVQFNHRYSNGLSLLSNFTWSHALDYNPYIGTGVPTFNVYDPNNLREEYGNSSLNVKQRFVAAATYQPQTHFHGVEDALLGGWRIAPIVQIQNGLPYTPSVSGSPSGLTIPNGATVNGATCAQAAGCAVTEAYKGVNGSGSSANRIVVLGRNQFTRPKTSVVDLRLGKNFYYDTARFGRYRLELFAELFNVLNHQNITGISTGAYSISGLTMTSVPTFGTYTNANSNYTYSQRQVQISARLHF